MDHIMLEKNLSIKLLHKMMLIRAFENTVSEYKMKRQIYGMAHCCNGQEAVAVGVCSALKKEDSVISTHRPHGHAIAKGVDPSKIMAEIFGKAAGTNGGKGGSMHICDQNVCFLPSTGIVGSGIPVACGAAFAFQYKKENKLSCVFFGDGAANEGVFHECLNFASVWNLPLLFVLEDNGLAVTTQTKDTTSCSDYVLLASAYKIRAMHINGQDVEEVYIAATEAADYVRCNRRAMLLHINTIRFQEHAEGEYYLKMRDTNYRDQQILSRQIEQDCPIHKWCDTLQSRGIITQIDIKQLEHRVFDEMNASLDFALNSAVPAVESAYESVF